jgi:hypothetical protein
VAIRDNRFARQARQRNQHKRNAAQQDNQPSIDEQLARLEEDLRRLKIESDIYFNGGAKRPPYDTKSRVEVLIKRLGDDRALSFAQRYLYNSLVARYTAWREVWRRTMQDREESHETPAAKRAAVLHRSENAANIAAPSESFICANAHTDVPTVKRIYEALVEAKRKCGEAVDDLSFPRFHHMIATKTENLKERAQCERVRFSIEMVNGKVSFKARAENE